MIVYNLAAKTSGKVEFIFSDDNKEKISDTQESGEETNASSDVQIVEEKPSPMIASLGDNLNQTLIMIGIILCIVVLLLKLGRSRRK